VSGRTPIGPGRFRWLEGELERWRAAGIVDTEAAARIREDYAPGTKAQATRLFLVLGALLAGVGLIWLIASNLEIEEIGPLMRFAGVALIWLALVAAAEAAGRSRFDVLAGPLRLLAVLAYGATIFQVAQSLQVPAFAPELLLAWAAGGIVFSYATGAAAALTLSVAVLGGWFVWGLGERTDTGAAFVIGLGLAVPAATAIAALHGEEHERLAEPWWVAAACFTLVALLSATFPDFAGSDGLPAITIVSGALGALTLCAMAIWRARQRIPEIAGSLLVAVAAVGLTVVAPGTPDEAFFGPGQVSGAETAYILGASAAFLAGAVGVAALGVRRSMPGLTNLAFLGVLVFVAVQSFGLIADILSGAALALCVGAILMVIGLVLDRGRRTLLREAAP